MKRKLLSLILVLMLLPVASLFGACGKDKGYNLNNLKTDFQKISTNSNNITMVDNHFGFDYSGHNNLETIISTNAPYKELDKYNIVFYNLMDFSCEYIDECSNNALTSDIAIKNRVKHELDELAKAVGDVDKCIDMFAEIVNVASGENVVADACLVRYENLLETYADMFESAINFNNTLSNLYFNYILKHGNPDVYSIGKANFDATVVVNKLKSRLSYQKSNLSQCFVEMYIDGDLAEKIAYDNVTFDLSSYGYSDNIEAINVIFDEETAAFKANHEDFREEFFALAVSAQNIQSILNNDKGKFVTACNAIDYGVVLASIDIATAYNKMCVEIIKGNYNLIVEYNNILVSMLAIITNTGA